MKKPDFSGMSKTKVVTVYGLTDVKEMSFKQFERKYL